MSVSPTFTPEMVMRLLKAGMISKDKAREMIEMMAAPPMVVVSPGDATILPPSAMQPFIHDPLPRNMREQEAMNVAQGPSPTPKWTLYDKLAMRLNIMPGGTFGFDFLHIFNNGRKVFVFIAHQDQAAYVEDDDPTMFPTDTFMARYYLVHDSLTGSGKTSNVGQQQPDAKALPRKP